MENLTMLKALEITSQVFLAAQERKTAPLTVAILDRGGALISLQRQDGSSMMRPEIAIAKAWGRSPLVVRRGKSPMMPRPAPVLSRQFPLWHKGTSFPCRAACLSVMTMLNCSVQSVCPVTFQTQMRKWRLQVFSRPNSARIACSISNPLVSTLTG